MSGHILRSRIEQACRDGGFTLGELSVLSSRRDPYRLDTPSMHRDDGWLAEQIARLNLATRLPMHLRGLHYALVAATDCVRPDGKPYKNDDRAWTWLSEVAAKAARWIGYVPFDDIVDERNEAPTILVPGATEARPTVYCSFDFTLPDPDDLEPVPALVDFNPRQPYRIVLTGEKTSLRPILEPLARRYGTELVLPTGEMSDTLVKGIADQGAADRRPLVVIYFADFDPAGWAMPVNVARKLQALQDHLVPDLPPFRVYRAAMLPEQVARLGLPSTPLKDTEARADGWRARWQGLEQTEIDALAALRPHELERIAEAAIAPFYDKMLSRRVSDARVTWNAAASAVLERAIDPSWLAQARTTLQDRLDEIEPELRRLQASLELDVEMLDLPPVPTVEPDLDGLPAAPAALWDSGQDWTTGTRRLVADLAHADAAA